MKRVSSRAQSPQAAEYHRLYQTPEWRRLRKAQLARESFCRMCARIGRRTQAVIADHVVPHRGDRMLFFDPSNLQSLCDPHHKSEKARIENGRPARIPVGLDGWPLE